jgi:hypothetical protein
MAWYAHYGVQIYRVRNWNIRGWCAPSIARGIPRPAVSKYTGLGGGPTWKDARQLLQSTRGSTPVTLHARAILSLCSIYALKEIADFLGHRDPRSIGIYAKHDTRSLPRPSHGDTNTTNSRISSSFWAARGELEAPPMPPICSPGPRTFVPYVYCRTELRLLSGGQPVGGIDAL